jgi:UDP-N-acetylglucosamine acyltransferase
MAASHIGHDAVIGDFVTLTNSAHIGGHAHIGQYAFISGNVSVHQHVRIGPYAMLGASSYAAQDIPPWCLAQGVPGRVAGLNVVGLRRNGFSPERRRGIKALFRMLYRENRPLEEIKKSLAGINDDDAKMLLEFLQASKRGVMASRRKIKAAHEE